LAYAIDIVVSASGEEVVVFQLGAGLGADGKLRYESGVGGYRGEIGRGGGGGLRECNWEEGAEGKVSEDGVFHDYGGIRSE
jgi:hypothetical protein